MRGATANAGPRQNKNKFFLNNMEANIVAKNQKSGRHLRNASEITPNNPQSEDVSPSMNYSRNVLLSSNVKMFEPETIIRAYRLNKLNHKDFNPALINTQWRRNFKEIINSKVDKQDPNYVDVSKEFSENRKLVIKKGMSREPVICRKSMTNSSMSKEAQKKFLTTKSLFQKFERMMRNNQDQD